MCLGGIFKGTEIDASGVDLGWKLFGKNRPTPAHIGFSHKPQI